MEYLKKISGFLRKRFLGEELTEDEQREALSKNYNDWNESLKKKTMRYNVLVPTPNLLNPTETIRNKALTDAIDAGENLLKGRFKYYGNWAGAGYSGGRFYDQDEVITKEDIYNNPPVDEFDKLTLQHDLRYQKASIYETLEQRKKALREADEIFIKDAEKLLKERQLDVKQRLATRGAILAFKAKLASDIGYNIERLPEDKINQAKQVVNEYFNIRDATDIPTNTEYKRPQGLMSNIQDEYNVELPKKIDNIENKMFPQRQSNKKDIEMINAILDIINNIDIDE